MVITFGKNIQKLTVADFEKTLEKRKDAKKLIILEAFKKLPGKVKEEKKVDEKVKK